MLMKTISLTEDEVAAVVAQIDLLIYRGKLSQQQGSAARKVRKMLVNRLDEALNRQRPNVDLESSSSEPGGSAPPESL